MPQIGVRAAARILGVHENTVRNFVKRGWLTEYHLPLGGQYLRLDVNEVIALADAMRQGKPAYRDRYPCAHCRTGYLDCVALWNSSNMMCCIGCEGHPMRFAVEEPYTVEEIEDMKERHARG